MAYPLQFMDVEVDTPSPGHTIPLTVGSSFQPNDLRIIFVHAGSTVGTVTLGSFPGWTATYNANFGSPINAVLTQKLTAASVDGTLTFATHDPDNVIYGAVTVRNWDSTQTLSATQNTASSASSPLSFSSTGVTAGVGAVLTWFDSYYSPITNTTPSGLTLLGNTNNSGPGYSASAADTSSGALLFGQSFTSGSSAAKTVSTAPISNNVSNQIGSAFSIFVRQASDVTSAITASAETDAGIAVTSAMLPSTTSVITPALEVDNGVEVYNPLQAQSIRPPVYLAGNPVTASRVTWSAFTPAAGSSVKVETSLDGGVSWQTPLNGGAVPGLQRGDVTTPVVLTRATMNRLLSTDTSPYFVFIRTDVSVDTSYNELVSLGVFLITQVDIIETGGPSGTGTSGGGSGNGVTGTGGSSVGGGLSLTVSGVDLSYAISRNTWTDIYYVSANTNYATAALEIAQNRLPGINSDVSSTEVLAQRLLFGTEQGADPWQDIQDMGTAIGYEAYFDPIATFRFKPIADPALTPSVWTVSDAANPVMVSYTRSISDSTTYNYVVVSGESTSNEVPVSAVAFDNDPSSPTYCLGPYNIVTTTFISAMITTKAQAQQAADALLLVVKGASETVEITMVPNPALEPGDIITVTRTFNGQKIIQGTFKINSVSTPLAQSQAQTLVCYRQSAAQG